MGQSGPCVKRTERHSLISREVQNDYARLVFVPLGLFLLRLSRPEEFSHHQHRISHDGSGFRRVRGLSDPGTPFVGERTALCGFGSSGDRISRHSSLGSQRALQGAKFPRKSALI